MNNILRPGGNNTGGGHSILAIPFTDFATFPGPLNGQLAFQPTLLAGKQWYQLDCTEGKLSYAADQNDTPHGDIWKVTIRGFLRGDNQSLKAQFEEWARIKRFVVQVKDNTLVSRLAGNPSQWMEFSYKNQTGSDMADLRGYSYEFTGTMFYDPPIYAW